MNLPEREEEAAGRPSANNQEILQQQPPVSWNEEEKWWEKGQPVAIGELFRPRRLETPMDRLQRRRGGKRSRSITQIKRGRYIRAVPSPRHPQDLALDATLRAAAPYQQARRRTQPGGPLLRLRPQDYYRKVRVRRTANLVLFVVDASWSMAVEQRMEATKGAILSLLTDAYQRRDRVGLIVFRGTQAAIALAPTNSVELAKKALVNLPVGGKTPLAAGLWLALHVIKQERLREPELAPLLVLLTDGAGNVSMGLGHPQEEAYQMADAIAEAKIRAVVIDMEDTRFNQGLAKTLADHMDAIFYNLAHLRAEALADVVRKEMKYG